MVRGLQGLVRIPEYLSYEEASTLPWVQITYHSGLKLIWLYTA